MRKTVASVAALAAIALLAPLGAGAATVVNGDFETGTLSGWTSVSPGQAPEDPDGWFAYTGTESPLGTEFEPISVQAPPQGKYGAITAQTGPGVHILYQDVALEPYFSHTLSLTAYYNSYAPISSPESLDPDVEEPNQQYRIDVIKPTAPITTLSPADILASVFSTKTGAPETLGPTALTADLSPFAGQTVRLRFVEVDNELYFAAGTDAVSIASTPPSGAFTMGKLKLNRKKGTARLKVDVPGPGTVVVKDARATTASASAKKKAAKRIKRASVTAVAGGTVFVTLKPTTAGRKILKEKHKLAIKALVSFTPTGGTTTSQTLEGKLKLKASPPPKSGYGR